MTNEQDTVPLAAQEPSSEQPVVDHDEEGNADQAESSPLLGSNQQNPTRRKSSIRSSIESLRSWNSKKKRPWRWPSIIALSVLIVLMVLILGFGFAAPAVMEEYAKEATVFTPTGLSLDSFTDDGVNARIQGDFKLDASRVTKKSVRDIGRMVSWIAKAVESRESTVQVYLPDYGNTLLGTAIVPTISVVIQEGITTHVDFNTHLAAGDLDGLKTVAKDWIGGEISSLRIQGDAIVTLKSGIFNLGTQTLSESLIFNQADTPTLPDYNISKLNFHEVEVPGKGTAMEAEAAVKVANIYPVEFSIPSLSFEVRVPGCSQDEPRIRVATAKTRPIDVKPKQDINVEVEGLLTKLPDDLTALCPTLLKSPLDLLLADYLSGDDMTVYISGSNSPGDAPQWLSDFMRDIVVPVEFHGKTFDNLIRDFSLKKVHFGLPDPFSGNDSPDSKPRVSATIKALIALPDEMNFSLNVSRIKADANIYYHDKKLGKLALHDWQKASSKRVIADDGKPGLELESVVEDAPINITDNKVFADVVQKVVFGGKEVVLAVEANVDVETKTVLGQLVVRDIPAKGEVFVNPFTQGSNQSFAPKIGDLQLFDTGPAWIKLTAKVNFTNPTEYSATVPYFDVKLLNNGTELGSARARNVSVHKGENIDIPIEAIWEPEGAQAMAQGREVLSQYISGYNVTLTIQAHEGTVPSQPALGLALSNLPIDIPAPALHVPKQPSDPDKDRDPQAPNFIDDAVFYIISSTATFTILSPLPTSSIWVKFLNATALYNHTEEVGKILFDLPWEVPPGISKSPALPVDWSLGSVGYDAIKDAIGGRLKLDARAEANIQVDKWEQSLWLHGRGIGAHIKI